MPDVREAIRNILDWLRQRTTAASRRSSAIGSQGFGSQEAGTIHIELDEAHRDAQPSAAAGDRRVSTNGSKQNSRLDAATALSIRNNTVLLYVALALAILIPGIALTRTFDFVTLQRLLLDISFGRGLRFWLGIVGAIMMGLLLLYPLRKKFAQHVAIGSINNWFHLHIILGILGPVLIFYHANFGLAVRDFNANVALITTLIVVLSGFIGQFIYTRASIDFYGAKKDVRGHLDALTSELKALDASDSHTAVVIEHIDAFERKLPTSRQGVVQSVVGTFQIQMQHHQLFREISALLSDAQRRYSWPQQEYQRVRSLVGAHLAASTSIARRASINSIVEQLWSRWRLLHLPLFLIMAIATVLHVWTVWDSSVFSRGRVVATTAAPTGNVPTAIYTPDDAINALRRWDATTQALTTGQQFFANASYVGSASCQACHQEQHNEWANTWHAKMYRTVNDPSAKGSANIVIGAFDGQPIKFSKVRVPSEDGKETGDVDFEVIPRTSHPETRAPGYFFTVRDPSTPADAQTFQVAIVIGGNMEQMYHVKVGDKHFPAPLRWRVAPQGMSAWQIDNTPQPGNWIFFRGGGNANGKPRTEAQLPFDRFAEAQCMGCHTTGYRFERDATPRNAPWSMVGNSVDNGVAPNGVLTGPKPGAAGTGAEFGVGCESCHGPGSSHNAAQSDAGGSMPTTPKPLVAGKILHPLKHLSPLQQSMQCAQCHSRGDNDVSPGTTATPARATNLLGFPDVLARPGDRGFLPGDTDLGDRIRIFGGFGQRRQSFWPNDWAKQGRMQWQDFTRSAHYASNTASCLTCHSGHAPMKGRIDNDRFQLRQSGALHAGISKTENQCESCHKATGSTMQPNKEMFEGSVMQKAGVTCISCHMAQVATRTGRTTKTPAKGDGTFDTSPANFGKHWDVSSHTSRVAPTSDSAQLAAGIGMRSACASCHGPEPRPPVGTEQSDQKLDEVSACRKDFVRSRLELLQNGIKTVESKKGVVLGKARAELQFVIADRSWGAHNWDKTLITLRTAAEEIASSCSGEAACQLSKAVTVATQECSIRTAIVLPPRVAAVAPPVTSVPSPGAVSQVTQPAANPVPVAPASAAPPVAALPAAPPPNVALNSGVATKPTAPAQTAVAVPVPPVPSLPSVPAALAPLTVFKDCPTCPEMIAVPVGEFMMGSPGTEKGRSAVEGPVRKVIIAKPFVAGRYAITVEQFDAFVAETKHAVGPGCRAADVNRFTDRPELSYQSPGFAQTAQHPVVCVTYIDAAAYAKWLSTKTGKPYRVLSESEREYVSRAGTATAYWWGDAFDARIAAHDTRLRPASTTAPIPGSSSFQSTVPVQSFRANGWGFFQVHGNVAEWTTDCWNRTLAGLPTDGSPATTGDCAQRVLRGGGWSYWPEDLRSAYREAINAEQRYVHIGFRIARDLEAGQ
jgi:formylglycine-generating enzyme required for sulfatase activity